MAAISIVHNQNDFFPNVSFNVNQFDAKYSMCYGIKLGELDQ